MIQTETAEHNNDLGTLTIVRRSGGALFGRRSSSQSPGAISSSSSSWVGHFHSLNVPNYWNFKLKEHKTSHFGHIEFLPTCWVLKLSRDTFIQSFLVSASFTTSCLYLLCLHSIHIENELSLFLQIMDINTGFELRKYGYCTTKREITKEEKRLIACVWLIFNNWSFFILLSFYHACKKSDFF